MSSKDSAEPSGNQVPASENPTEPVTQPTSVIPFNVDPPSTSAPSSAGGVPPSGPPAAPPAVGPGHGGPGSGNSQIPPRGPGGLFASNWARLAALVGGIVVAVMLLGGGAIAVAAATGNLGNDNHRQTSNRFGDRAEKGFGNNGPRGFMGRGRGNSDGDNQGMPGQQGQGQDRLGGQGLGQGGLMGMLPGGIAGVEHGDFAMQGADGKAVTMRMVRGTVTDVTAKAITVKATDGYTVAYQLTSTTKISRNGAPIAAGAIVKGDPTIAVGTVSGKTVTATWIMATTASR